MKRIVCLLLLTTILWCCLTGCNTSLSVNTKGVDRIVARQSGISLSITTPETVSALLNATNKAKSSSVANPSDLPEVPLYALTLYKGDTAGDTLVLHSKELLQVNDSLYAGDFSVLATQLEQLFHPATLEAVHPIFSVDASQIVELSLVHHQKNHYKIFTDSTSIEAIVKQLTAVKANPSNEAVDLEKTFTLYFRHREETQYSDPLVVYTAKNSNRQVLQGKEAALSIDATLTLEHIYENASQNQIPLA